MLKLKLDQCLLAGQEFVIIRLLLCIETDPGSKMVAIVT